MTSLLAGMALDYLIGAGHVPGIVGRITEVAYDVDQKPAHGEAIAYCNLFDELNSGKYPPYRKDTATAGSYGEGVIDARGPGFEKNLRAQFLRRKAARFDYIELDNPDAYALADVLRATALAEGYGLKVIAKNALVMDDNATQWIAHPNVYGVIVEADDDLSARAMDALRRKAGRPDLPVWFVSFGDQKGWAQRMMRAIKVAGLINMGVTHSRRGEYGSSDDILLPIKRIK